MRATRRIVPITYQTKAISVAHSGDTWLRAKDWKNRSVVSVRQTSDRQHLRSACGLFVRSIDTSLLSTSCSWLSGVTQGTNECVALTCCDRNSGTLPEGFSALEDTPLLISGNESSAVNDIGASPAFRWSMLFVGLAVGFLGLDVMVRRPMMRELAQVHNDLKTVEGSMDDLVGQRNHVWETNNLLTSLKSQYRAFEEARVSLSAMKLLRKEIETESTKTKGALASLEQLVSVQNSILSNTQNVSVAEGSLDRMIAMQQDVVDAAQSSEQALAAIGGLVKVCDAATTEAKDLETAFAAINGLGKLKSQVIENGTSIEIAQSEVQMAFDNLKQFVNLKNEVLSNSEGLEVAQTEVNTAFDNVRQFVDLKTLILNNGEGLDVADAHLNAFIDLKNDIIDEAASVEVAQEVARTLIEINTDLYNEFENALVAQSSATDLIALKNTIVSNGENTEKAFANTNNLFALRDTLNAEMDLVKAQGNLQSLVRIQDDLNAQTRQVADAVDTLELLTDLGEELQAQVKTMGQMRKSLMDIVLMEATVSRVAKIIEPLVELTNLRRMSDDDVREAARTIMESRTSRIATRRDNQRRTADESLKLDDIDLFQTEQPKDIFVPPPRDEDIDRILDGIK
jgi:hypothetical protein